MNEAWLESIERYLNNEMNAEEKLLFESEMRTNGELSSYFNLYKEIEITMRSEQKSSEEEVALKASLKNLNIIYFKKEDVNEAFDTKESPTYGSENMRVFRQGKKHRTIKMQSIIAVAAVITGIVVLSVAFYINRKKKNTAVAVNTTKKDTTLTAGKHATNQVQKNIYSESSAVQKSMPANSQAHLLTKEKQEELFKDNFKPDVVPEITEGPLDDAFSFYANHNYTNAAEEFTTADINTATRGFETDTKLTAFYADYYAGLSYLAEGNTSAAIAELIQASGKSSNNLFQIKTQWYLSLAYLKKGEIKKADNLLTKISRSNNSTAYRLKAIKLLNELK